MRGAGYAGMEGRPSCKWGRPKVETRWALEAATPTPRNPEQFFTETPEPPESAEATKAPYRTSASDSGGLASGAASWDPP